MKRFNIEYFTSCGESLYMHLDDSRRIAMSSNGNGIWSAEVELGYGVSYGYELCSSDGEVLRREEFGNHRVMADGDVEFFDHWLDLPQDKQFYSSLFTEGVFRRDITSDALQIANNQLVVCVDAPTLRSGERLAIVGSAAEIGGWRVDNALLMNDSQAPTWSVALPRSVAGSEYKFVILDSSTNALIQFEQGDNRVFPTSDSECVIVSGLRLRDGRRPWRGAGVAIPLFSIRSADDWGCGDFKSLTLLGEWAASVGMSVIQLLPINDTTASGSWRDSYPYNAISSFALHPIYLDPRGAAKICDSVADASQKRKIVYRLKKYAAMAAPLNELQSVDYEQVVKLKDDFLRELYRLCGAQVLNTAEYEEFFKQSREWLLPYMVYCTLRDRNHTVDFKSWPALSKFSARKVSNFAKENADEVGFYGFVQYLLDVELREAREKLHRCGVALKGDIPIGVSPVSVDVWSAPELYNTTMSAGAPPDAFAEDGQNWGFPTYNWERMAQDDYAWWRSRLTKMARYFDAYRIDHILGFFRIWEVPRGAKSAILGHFYPSMPYSAEQIIDAGFKFDRELHVASDISSVDTLFVPYPGEEELFVPRIEGYKCSKFAKLEDKQKDAYLRLHEEFFYHRHNEFWKANAMRRLPRLMASNGMLTCGEDLGMIPACVPEVMESERILSLEIERMPKSMGVAFGDTLSYPYLSVAATSTHDMSTIRGWWREDYALTQRYWHEVLHRDGEAEKECSGRTARMIIERHMLSGSMLAILPLQDWLAIDEQLRACDPDAERINVPANPNHYWRYRMHLTVEQLRREENFNSVVRELVEIR